MNLHSETAAPMGSIIGNGGPVVMKAVAASSYLTTAPLATEINVPEYAARKVSAKLRLRIETARVVCQLAGLAVRS